MRVVSWNIHRGFGMDRKYNPERIATILKGFNADLIALQEVDSSLRSDDGTDQLNLFASILEMNAVMGPTLKRDYGAYGNAVLSRFPLSPSIEHNLSYRKLEPRGALVVDVTLKQSPLEKIKVINTHLGLKYWERAFQIDQLFNEIIGEEALLLGDFNEWCPFSGNARRMQKKFGVTSPRLPTFPAKWPRFALDRIFLSIPVVRAKFEVPRVGDVCIASDHLPLIADIEF